MSRYEKIWRAVRRVPYGRVATYGQIARIAGMEGMSRLVGYALHALPERKKVPWHRVINAAGRISLVGPVARKQRALLEAEGIRFTPNGKINLQQFRWEK
jgi:methylated-DNA-protein-cysteine methyltransferase related protein